MSALTFRPITPDDIPLLHRWRNQPHIARWWEPSKITLAEAREEYGAYMRPDYGVMAYIVSRDGAAFGYVQAWRVEQFPEYKPYVPLTDSTYGLDVFIGEPSALYQGWGVRMMRAFIRDYVFSMADVPAVIIDPVPDNASAIRAYEKVGFVHERTFMLGKLPVYFMRLTRAAFVLDKP